MSSDEEANVERSIRELGIDTKLRPYSHAEAQRLYDELESRFAEKKGARWIWEHLRLPSSSRQFSDQRAFERLPRLIPNSSEELVFIPGSDNDTVCAYRGTIDVITAVIADCSAFEYCVTPLGMDWLVCENHHGVLIAVGDPVVSRLPEIDR
jgi:hypothetical protein